MSIGNRTKIYVIKNEKRKKRKCIINYIMIYDSIGSDGWIRFWFYETIDHADLSDDEQFLEIQPIYEFQIAEENENAMLMSIQKQEPNSEKTMWYAQVSTLYSENNFNIEKSI